jgi:hypothetical protein
VLSSPNQVYIKNNKKIYKIFIHGSVFLFDTFFCRLAIPQLLMKHGSWTPI